MTKRRSISSVGKRSAQRNRSLAAPTSGVEARPGDLNFMTSLARGLAVIRAFSQQGEALTITQISAKIDIPRAAVRRCLYTLERLGYIASDTHKFSLQPKILALGYAYLSSHPLAVSAQPFIDRVSATVHESCSLATLDENEILYVARSTSSRRIMSVDISVGSRLPAYCTSMGRVLLAHLPSSELDLYLARAKLRPFTERTITAREKFRQMLDGVHRNGYAVVDQELEIGLRSIAVPVRDMAGAVTAAMNIGAQATRISVRDMETKFLPYLRTAAEELSLLLVP